MQLPGEPLRSSRRRTLAVAGVGVAIVAATLWWAASVPKPGPVNIPELQSTGAATRQDHTRAVVLIDASAFNAAIWNPIPPPPPQAKAQPTVVVRQPPPSLELVCLVRQMADGTPGRLSDRLMVALHDPAADELHIVGPGERVAAWTVAAVDESGATLTAEGGHKVYLELKREITTSLDSSPDVDHTRRRR